MFPSYQKDVSKKGSVLQRLKPSCIILTVSVTLETTKSKTLAGSGIASGSGVSARI